MANTKSDLIYGIEDIPPTGETLVLGFQHYLTMFGSTVAIPLFLAEPLGIDVKTPEGAMDLGFLIATMFFVSGITTLLQTTWGNRLPIVQGGTFSFFGPTFAICGMAALEGVGWEVRMQHVQGAIIAGAVVEVVIGATGLVGRMLRFVGPITIAPTIALIGLSLFKHGAPKAGAHWPIGGLTIFLIILFSQYLRTRGRAFELYPIMMHVHGFVSCCGSRRSRNSHHCRPPQSHQHGKFPQCTLVSCADAVSVGLSPVWCGGHCGHARGLHRIHGGVHRRLLRLCTAFGSAHP